MSLLILLKLTIIIDGSSVISDGLPVKLKYGEAVPRICNSEDCYIPGQAIRHGIQWDKPFTLFQPLAEGSTIQRFQIENNLGPSSKNGKVFKTVSLSFIYRDTPDASPQTAGPIIFKARGEDGSKQIIQFLGTGSGESTISIKGRAYGADGQSYHDIPERTVKSKTTLINEEWLKKP